MKTGRAAPTPSRGMGLWNRDGRRRGEPGIRRSPYQLEKLVNSGIGEPTTPALGANGQKDDRGRVLLDVDPVSRVSSVAGLARCGGVWFLHGQHVLRRLGGSPRSPSRR